MLDPKKINATLQRWFSFDRVILVLLVLICYSACLFSTYGYTDDFWLYFTTDHVPRTYLQAARPVAALAWSVSSSFVDELSDLRFLRFVGILGIALIALLLYRESLRIFRSRVFSMASALGIVFLPAMTVFANWATCWIYPWAIVATLLGARSIEIANVHFDRCRSLSIKHFILGGGLIMLALGTYQPTITWYWLLVLFRILSPRYWSSERFRYRLIRQVMIGLGIFCLGLLAIKFYFLVFGFTAQDRAGLLTHLGPKIQSLIRIQIPLCLNLWQVIDVQKKWLVLTLTVASSLVLLAGCWKVLSKFNAAGSIQRGALWCIGVLAILGFSHVHWLAIDDNPKNYRTAMTLASCLSLLVCYSLYHILESRCSTRAISAIGIVLILVASIKARLNSTYYWIRPYSQAHEFLVKELSERLDSQIEQVHIVRQSAEDGIVRERNIYSFGKPYTDFLDDDVVHFRGILNAALIDADLRRHVNKLPVSHSAQEPYTDKSVLVIDFRDLKNLE